MVPPVFREKVIFLYYEKGKTITDIAKELGISTTTISRIIRNDTRFLSEKERRKKESEKNKKEYLKTYKKQKRDEKKELINEVHKYFENNYSALDYSFPFVEEKIAQKFNLKLYQVTEILKKHPLYDTLEKSRKLAEEEMLNKLHQIEIYLTVKKRKISTESLFLWLRNAYDYDSKKEAYIFNEKFGKKPADIPQRYNVHSIYTSLTNELRSKIEKEKRESQVEQEVIDKEDVQENLLP